MIPDLEEATKNLSSSDLFDLSQQTNGYRSPLSVYAHAVRKTLCQQCFRPLCCKLSRRRMKIFPPICVTGALCPYFVSVNH